MGCILKFLLLSWLLTLAWNHLILPLFRNASRQQPPPDGDDTSRADAYADNRRRYLSLLMPLLAKIAKADGRVSEREISGIETIFRELNLTPDERRLATRIFAESKDTPEQFDLAARAFAAACANFELRVITFQFLARVACADGTISPRERAMLARAARFFGLPDFLAAQILANIAGRRFWYSDTNGGPGGGSGFGGGDRYRRRSAPPPRPAEPTRADDLALLGLPQDASDDAIRKAYRQKVKELHPDRLQAQGLPESMLKPATERMAAINAAYARLVK